MTEPDTSVEIVDESVSKQPADHPQGTIQDCVTETTIQKKELSLSVDYDSENLHHRVRYRDQNITLASVAGALEDIQEWVEDTNDEEWELYQFRLETTIVAQRTEEEENFPDEEEGEIENSLIRE